MNDTKGLMKWWLPILLMALITPLTPWLDLLCSRYFYEGEGQFLSNRLIQFVYNYGCWPGNIVAGFGMFFFLSSFFVKKWRSLRTNGLILALTMIVGSGLIVHLILKDHWGRPRPKQIMEFGGRESFRPYYQPNFQQSEPFRSFPCGHCSTGFYFFAVALIGQQINNKRIFWAGLFLAFFLGGLLSFTRMAQGGHFFSDTLISALIMWETGLFFIWITKRVNDEIFIVKNNDN